MRIELEVILKLFLALALGGFIGYERESAHKSAGLRTNILVCLGATLIMLLESFYRTINPDAPDHLRMAAQIVTGIGFLGAGTIIHNRSAVRGLTTAASIWVTAAVGMAVGMGFYYAAIVVVVLALISLKFLRKLEIRLAMKGGRMLMIDGESRGDFVKRLSEAMEKKGISIRDIRLSVGIDRKMEVTARIPIGVDIDTLISEIMKLEGVYRVITELPLD